MKQIKKLIAYATVVTSLGSACSRNSIPKGGNLPGKQSIRPEANDVEEGGNNNSIASTSKLGLCPLCIIEIARGENMLLDIVVSNSHVNCAKFT